MKKLIKKQKSTYTAGTKAVNEPNNWNKKRKIGNIITQSLN